MSREEVAEPADRDRQVLSQKQERRLIACQNVRQILVPRTFSSTGGISAREVIELARYIVTGEAE